MDLLTKALGTVTVGCITQMYGIIVYRTGRDAFTVGETISVRAPRITLAAAAQKIWDITHQR